MRELFLVKLGGSLITDKSKPFTPRSPVISRLAKEIHEVHSSKPIRLIVGHGGGSFTHALAAAYQVHKGFRGKKDIRGVTLVQNSAAQLNRLVISALLVCGEKAVSLPPSACSVAHYARIADWHLPSVKEMLEFDLVPVPYGDVVMDLKQGWSVVSTEEILSFLARKLHANRVVVACCEDGVLDKNGKVIKEINSKNFTQVRKFLKKSESIDVTGGMAHKVERLLELAEFGIESEIINGLVSGRLKAAIEGRIVVGTRIRGG